MAAEPKEIYTSNVEPLRLVETVGHEIGTDGLGYTLVPYPEDEDPLSLENLIHIPTAYARGLGRGALGLFRHYLGDPPPGEIPETERRTVTVSGHERSLLITPPDPELGIDPQDAIHEFNFVALTEHELGSAANFHTALSQQFRDRQVVTVFTPGVSLRGSSLPLKTGYNRTVEETAAGDLVVAREIAQDAPSNVTGTSFGSKRAVLVAALNGASHGESQMNIDRVRVVSSAIGARDVPEQERFSEVDASDQEFVQGETRKFAIHTAGDMIVMGVRHPAEAVECSMAYGAYVLAPHRLPARVAAIAGNLRSTQEGVDWGILKDVARAGLMHVIGGASDTLMQTQLPQWLALQKHAPRTQIRLLERYGHTMTIAAPKVVQQLAIMELADVA